MIHDTHIAFDHDNHTTMLISLDGKIRENKDSYASSNTSLTLVETCKHGVKVGPVGWGCAEFVDNYNKIHSPDKPLSWGEILLDISQTYIGENTFGSWLIENDNDKKPKVHAFPANGDYIIVDSENIDCPQAGE